MGAALGVEGSLFRCESDTLIRALLSLFLRNSLEGIVTCGDLALCVEGEDDLEALAACSSVDLGLASRSSLDVETALLPAVLRLCDLRGGCCDRCPPADSGVVGIRSVLRLCALVKGVAKPSLPSFPSPVQIQNNAVRKRERCGVRSEAGGRVRDARADRAMHLCRICLCLCSGIPESGVVWIMYKKSTKKI